MSTGAVVIEHLMLLKALSASGDHMYSTPSFKRSHKGRDILESNGWNLAI